MNFIKTTVIGGLLFLVPVTVLVLVLGKAIVVMHEIADPMADFLPVDAIGGVALANIIAVLVLILFCFLAGLVARTAPARKLAEGIETAILQKLPGYTMLKGFTTTLNPEENKNMKAVFVKLGNHARVGLEVEEIGSQHVAVYFPGSPNAWAGIVQIVSTDEIQYID